MNIYDWIKKNTLITSIIVVFLVIICFFLLWYFFPEQIYDQFIWKYFWGPILSDGLNKPMTYHGVEAAPKFTIVSEIIYGVVVASALYGLYQLLKKWEISIDFSFFLGLLPFVLYGSIARVLEDSQFFTEPLVFWFVTPLIYIQALIITLLAISIAVYLNQVQKLKKYSIPLIMGIIGLILLIPFLYYMISWMTGSMWGVSSGLFLNVFLLVIIVCTVITAAVYISAKYIQAFWHNSQVFSAPLNLSMIFGHQLDGIASYVSIYDPLHMGLPTYIEKHPASNFLLEIWPPLFPIVKFILIIGIVYMLDIFYKEELQSQKLFVNLLKIGIFILGFAPGLRDLLRVMMGV